MGRPKNPLPKLCYHKPSGQFYVRLGGKPLYLGKDQLAAEAERLRVLAEVRAGVPRPAARAAGSGVTVSEALAAYRAECAEKYQKHGRPTSEYHLIGAALRPLRRLYGHAPVAALTQASLVALRAEVRDRGCGKTEGAGKGCSPGVTNQHMGRVTRFLRWCVNRGYCPASLWHDARALEPLRVERSPLDGLDVDPPPAGAVEATLPFCSPVLAAMIRTAALTGARPGEVCAMTPGQIDRTGERLRKLLGGGIDLAGCWAYLPDEHKCEHHGQLRLVPLGPRAQEVIAPFLGGRADGEPLFSPADSLQWFREQQRLARKTPVQPSQRDRSREGARRPRKAWDAAGFAQGIDQAIGRALKAGTVVEHWHPNQLRHLAATAIVEEFGEAGWEIARLVLGHASVSTTRIYVKDNAAKAFRAVGRSG